MPKRPSFPADWTQADEAIPFTNAPDQVTLLDARAFSLLSFDEGDVINRVGYDRGNGAYFYRDRKKVYLHRFVAALTEDIEGRRVGFLDRDNKNCQARNLFIYDATANRLGARRAALIERGYLECEG